MALKSTIYKAELAVTDLDRHYYATHQLTLARHPSETEERLMVRLLAFALCADERLAFGKGLSTDDEPDLWLKDLTEAIELWVEVGLPDEKRLRRACGRAARVLVLAYGGRAAEVWWQNNQSALRQMERLSVLALDAEASQALAAAASRNLRAQCTVQDGELYLTVDAHSLHIVPRPLLGGAA